MGFTKKQCREQKKEHFARKIYHKGSPKGNVKVKQSNFPKEVKEATGPEEVKEATGPARSE